MRAYAKILIAATIAACPVYGNAYAACDTSNPETCVGPQGPQGEQGPEGQQGPKGDKGDTGAQGIAGVNGVDGKDGAKGDKGDTGAQGAQGIAGVDGAPGAKGDKGDAGEKGDKGDQGIAGVKGDKGDKGNTGAQGVAGAKGDAGKDGKNGEDFDMSRYEEGLATVAALNVPHVEKNFAASGSAGFHNDKSAFGVGAAFRVNSTWQFGGSVAVGTGNGDVSGKAVLTGQW